MPDGAEAELEDIRDDHGDHCGPGHGVDGDSSSRDPGSGEDSSKRSGSNHGED
jgi:hypothetical protein